MPDMGYAGSQGLALLNQIVSDVGPIFTVAQAQAAAKTLGLSTTHVRALLSRLARGPWLARIKRGVYAAQGPLLATEIHPFAVAAILVTPSAISHWSALAYHGLTTQIPFTVQASTPQKVVTPEMRNGNAYRPRGRSVWRALGMEFEFVQVKQRHFFGFQEEWVSRWHRVRIADPERTVLDMVAYPQIFGSISVAMETLETHLEQLDLSRLVSYALRYDVGAVIKRLGWILETLGVDNAVIAPLQAYPVRTYYLLDTAGSSDGIPVARWRIRNNLRGEFTHAER